MPSPMFFITILNIGFIILVIFVQRRNSAATWAWVSAIALIPIGGFIIYMVFGQDSQKQRVFRAKTKDDNALLATYTGLGANEGDTTEDNRVTLFHDGVTKFEALLDDIANATDFIFVQYYIFRGDEVGKQLVNALAQRAKDGLEVRLLVDGMGCQFTKKEIFKPLMDAGGIFTLFLPPAPVRINFRNHRKLVVIDGNLAYLGGSNIGKEYLGKSKRFGYWRDTHMRLTGGSVSPITLRFIMDWNFAASKKNRGKIKVDKMELKPLYFTRNPQYFNNDPDVSVRVPPIRGAKVSIISSGPDTRYPNVLHEFVNMIISAKKSVYIQSPYFVPCDALDTALRIAALKGIDVRIMYPANPDHVFVYWAGSSYVGELMCAGVKGYEYTRGFIHSKTLMIDSEICAVGTANMDVRSFKINFETHAFIEDSAITQELEEAFRRDMEDCRALTLEGYRQRPKTTKIRESISRLFSPLI